MPDTVLEAHLIVPLWSAARVFRVFPKLQCSSSQACGRMLFPASLNLGMTTRLALTDEMLSGSEVDLFWEEVYKSQCRICQVPALTWGVALPKLVDGGFVGRPNSVCRAHGEKWKWKSLIRVQLFATPWTIHSPWDSPGQNTGVGSLSLLQGIFPIQGLNTGLPHRRQILYQQSPTLNSHEPWVRNKSLWPKPLRFGGCLSLQYNLAYSVLYKVIERYIIFLLQHCIIQVVH